MMGLVSDLEVEVTQAIIFRLLLQVLHHVSHCFASHCFASHPFKIFSSLPFKFASNSKIKHLY
jgi:hypothetical protein